MTDSTDLYSQLKTLAANLVWSWSKSTHAPFMAMNPDVWAATRSPWTVLRHTPASTLATLSEDKGFMHKVKEATGALDDYMNSKETWHHKNPGLLEKGNTAYFCAEFGLHESFPIYSGGLGILAGDHMKTASDMGLPMVGVGLLYRCGYVTQQVDGTGWQQDQFDELKPEDLPLSPALNAEGEPIIIHIPLLMLLLHSLVVDGCK